MQVGRAVRTGRPFAASLVVVAALSTAGCGFGPLARDRTTMPSSPAAATDAMSQPSPSPTDSPTTEPETTVELLPSTTPSTEAGSGSGSGSGTPTPVPTPQPVAVAPKGLTAATTPGRTFAKVVTAAAQQPVHLTITQVERGARTVMIGDQIPLAGGKQAVRVQATVDKERVKVLITPRGMYVSMPGDTESLPPGKTWIRLDAPDATSPEAVVLNGLVQGLAQGLDQSELTEQAMRDTTVRKVGSLVLDGTAFTRYDMTMGKAYVAHVAELSAQLLAADPDLAAQARAQVISSLRTTATYYLDSKARPRRVQIRTSMAGVSSSMTIDYSRWGRSVTIKDPTAASIVNLSDLLAEAQPAPSPSPSPSPR